jgi:penicillin-binding protein 1A
VIPAPVAEEAKTILHTVVTSGTGTHADIGDPSQWGKTGTTENNGDAWFCGATEDVTACVWVGYADTTTPMTTEFAGGPVDGGTFPALIWAGVISAWEQIRAERAAAKESGAASSGSTGSTYVPSTPTYGGPSTPAPSIPAPSAGATAPSPTPSAPSTPSAPATPAPTPAPAPGGGVSGGTGGAAAPG